MYKFYFSRLGLWILLLGISIAASAQKYSNEFLSIGVGARAQGMGNAVVAGIDDVTASVWNPAGLASFPDNSGLQLGAMHSEWFAGVGKFDYLGMTVPLANANRRIGLSVIRFGIDNIPNTLSLYEDDGTINYANISEFSAADYGIFLTYAQKLRTKNPDNKLLLGGNVKVIRRTIGSFANAWGFGVDLGLQYHVQNWRIGVVGKDLTSTFNAWSFNFTEKEKEQLAITGNDIPINSVEITRPQILAGLGYRLNFNKIGVAPELDIIVTTDGQRNTLISADPFSIDPAFGLEIDYNQYIFLRAGVNQFQQESDIGKDKFWTARPGIGVGLKLGALQLDYAFTDLGDRQNRYSHVISLLLNFKPKGQ